MLKLILKRREVAVLVKITVVVVSSSRLSIVNVNKFLFRFELGFKVLN